MLKEYDFDCKISFDTLLRNTIEEDMVKQNPDDFELIKIYFKNDIWFYARHFGIEGEPFTEYYLSSIPNDKKEAIKKSLYNLHSNMLDSLTYRAKTWNKLIEIIKVQIENRKTILLDIAYLKENDYKRLNNLNYDEIYKPFILLNYISLEDMTKVIKKRNAYALENHLCSEYRHIILNIYMYLKYFENKICEGNPDFVISEEKIENIIKEIPKIDSYAYTYHWEKFRTYDSLKEFKFPMNMMFSDFISFKNMINIEDE